MEARRRQQSTGFRRKRPRSPDAEPPRLNGPVGPDRTEWPSKVAIVAYGLHRGYEPEVIHIQDAQGRVRFQIHGPEQLASWAAAKGAGNQTYQVLLQSTWT